MLQFLYYFGIGLGRIPKGVVKQFASHFVHRPGPAFSQVHIINAMLKLPEIDVKGFIEKVQTQPSR
jgi:hypothetical protein